MDYKKLSRVTDSTRVSDSINPTTLIEEVMDADLAVIKREIEEKGSCFKTAEKIASLIGKTRGGVKQFEKELKDADIKGISYKKGEKDDYQGIHGTVVYGAEDSAHIIDSKPEELFEDIEEYKEAKGVDLAEQVKEGSVEVSAEDIAKEIGSMYNDDDIEDVVWNNFKKAGVEKVKFFLNNDSVDWECIVE